VVYDRRGRTAASTDVRPSDEEGIVLNRCVITVKAKKPFFDWIQTLPEAAGMTLDELNEDGIAYLLPDLEDDDDLESILPQCFDLIFEEELIGWRTDEKMWPVVRDLPTFLSWFDVQRRSIVIDLVDAPLKDDES
jgi:hypothetical protein